MIATSPVQAADAIVIGGGVAGLAAATLLAERGRRVLVLEARGQLGGRATAFRDRETGETVDNGQHVLFGCYHETFRLLARIGAEDRVETQASLAVPFIGPDGQRSELRCPDWPAPLNLLGGILRWDALSLRERLSALRLGAALRAGGDAAMGDESVSHWLRRHGQRGRIREWLWDPLAIAALNQSPDAARAESFARVLRQMFTGSRQDASLVLPRTPLDQMYALPARRFIEQHGGEVRLHALARVRLHGDAIDAVDLRGDTLRVPLVIAAVPWFGLAPLLTGDTTAMQAIVTAASAMDSEPIVTVNLWYDRPVMTGGDRFVGLPGRRIQWVFDKRQAFGEAASHLSLVVSAADALVAHDTPSLVALAVGEVTDALPLARTAALRHGTVVREKRATFSLAAGQPARPRVETPVKGLFLAGDWIATGLPGTIESAAVAGHAAAEAALATLS